MGGMIGQTFALKYPGVFQSMVLADTTSRRPPDAAKMWSERIQNAQAKGMGALVEGTLARWFTEPYRRAHPDVTGRIGDGIKRTPVAGFVGCCHAISKIDLTDRLKTIKCPTLVIVGEQDEPFHAPSTAMAETIPGARLVVIPDAGHSPQFENPDAWIGAMRAFLGALVPAL